MNPVRIIPGPNPAQWIGLRRLTRPFPSPSRNLTLTLKLPYPLAFHRKSLPFRPTRTSSSSTAIFAGRSKKGGDPSSGRISSEARRAVKRNVRRRVRILSQNLFYRRSRAAAVQADCFSEDELEMVGLGYDRTVQFMSKDDPLLRHPNDWYKYGKYGPYSWRGIVVGPPIRGGVADECVSLISSVRNHEEFERFDQFGMANEYSTHLKELNDSVGRRHYWVFVRHPKWSPSELPWQQWTLVSEVAVEASEKKRIDKWSLMGRLGNKTRQNVTQCAAWMRPDIIYVKKPMYQCRFEPQEEFFTRLWPLVDPSTESQFQFEVRREENGRVLVEYFTYFGGLCKIVKINPKAYVDDVVNAYEKLSDEGKLHCLGFLLKNHPVELLHPYTKEWKTKLEEMELGCDAPDESDYADETEDDEGGGHGEGEEDDDYVNEAEAGGIDEDDDIGDEDGEEDDTGEEDGEEKLDPEETQEYWNEKLKKAIKNPQMMEELVKSRFEASGKRHKQPMDEELGREEEEDDEITRREVDTELEQIKREWERKEFKRTQKTRKGKIPPELYLKSAVRPFTYRNLVKEIVLMRHAIVDGDISLKS